MPEGAELYGNEGTSGVFHVGTFGNEDYLYLKETGNGDSIASMYIFNTKENPGQYGDWSYDWLFYRDNDTENPADIVRDDTFYAWAWETDNIGIAHYGITERTDFSGLVNTRDWDSGYPLMMCEVSIDKDGDVEELRDVDIVMYSSYYMGILNPNSPTRVRHSSLTVMR